MFVFLILVSYFFFFNDTATTEIYTLSLHDALPIYLGDVFEDHPLALAVGALAGGVVQAQRSEEHTSELQSRFDLVCRLLLEKKKKEGDSVHTELPTDRRRHRARRRARRPQLSLSHT